MMRDSGSVKVSWSPSRGPGVGALAPRAAPVWPHTWLAQLPPAAFAQASSTALASARRASRSSSEGYTVENPRYFRKAEKKLKRLHRQLSRKKKGSKNRTAARKQLAKAHLKVQRQREDFARKQANALITSSDLIAFEDLKIRNLVKNRHLAKSIHDAGWGQFLTWVKAYGVMYAIPVIAVAPQWTSQNCSACGTLVEKSLSVRTHICTNCGLVLDRDQNAAKNILHKAEAGTVGHTGTDGKP